MQIFHANFVGILLSRKYAYVYDKTLLMSKLPNRDKSLFPKFLRDMRAWETHNLPRSGSYIAFDLFVLIGHSAAIEQPLTLKELFNSLEYSERGVRYVLEQFVDGGWCEIVGNELDKRSRRVVATELLRTKLIDYEEYLSMVYVSLLCHER